MYKTKKEENAAALDYETKRLQSILSVHWTALLKEHAELIDKREQLTNYQTKLWGPDLKYANLTKLTQKLLNQSHFNSQIQVLQAQLDHYTYKYKGLTQSIDNQNFRSQLSTLGKQLSKTRDEINELSARVYHVNEEIEPFVTTNVYEMHNLRFTYLYVNDTAFKIQFDKSKQ